ncbi:MAG: hypothetical protein MI742_10460 [Desulfobacterales bacterium]|nr:hypothetical protein [Desulfobacterales bacterium]
MFPFVWEWVWDVGHYIFFGGMWYALIIISVGMSWCIYKALKDTKEGKGGHHH